MSYDIEIGERDFNYTFNMSKLFYDHIDDQGKGGGLRELAGVTGAEGAVILAEGLRRMNETCGQMTEAAMREKYDPSNKWGSTLSAVLFIGAMIDACIEFPNEIIKVGI